MLKTRIITAAVLIGLLLVIILWLPPFATKIAMTAVVLAGAWEWSAFLRLQRLAGPGAVRGRGGRLPGGAVAADAGASRCACWC